MGTLLKPSKRWNEQLLENLRNFTDPTADQVIIDIIENDKEYSINRLFNDLVTNNDPIPPDMPIQVANYFKKTEILPEWFDSKKIKLAQEIYADFGPQANLVLFCKSLPSCYACSKGAQVMYATGRMSEHGKSMAKFTRRIMETAQFILNVMEPEGFSGTGKAIRSMQKVRLIHATIRYHLNMAPWDDEKLGKPINQEDLLGTMLSMSFQIAEGLQELNIPLNTAQKDAYAHLGAVLGYMMGIPEEVIPHTYNEAEECTAAILNHQVSASPEGTELTNSCLNFMADIIPGKKFDEIPNIYTRYLIGDELADLLNIEKNHNSFENWLVMKQMKFLNFVEDEVTDISVLLDKITEKVNKALLQGMINFFNDDKQVHFYIPPNLQDNWERIEVWKNKWTSIEVLNKRLVVQVKGTTISNKIEK